MCIGVRLRCGARVHPIAPGSMFVYKNSWTQLQPHTVAQMRSRVKGIGQRWDCHVGAV